MVRDYASDGLVMTIAPAIPFGQQMGNSWNQQAALNRKKRGSPGTESGMNHDDIMDGKSMLVT